MRIPRPKLKTAAVASVLAVSLVVAATSGSVAARLITTHDIKDGTIKKADLSKSVNNALKKTGQPGAPGEQGPAGEQGPQGVAGPAGPGGSSGSNGANGRDAELVAWNTFDGTGTYEPVIDDDTDSLPFLPVSYVKLAGDHDVEVDQPGTYLVSMRSTADVTELAESFDLSIESLLGLFGIISPAPPIQLTVSENDELTERSLSATVDTEALSRSCLSIVVCNTTYAVTVPSGGRLDLSDLWMLTLGAPNCDKSGDCETSVKVNIAVTRVAGTPADFIDVDPYTISYCQLVDTGEPCESTRLRPRQVANFIKDLVPSGT